MPIFQRIYNNKLYNIVELSKLGWTTDQEYPIAPDDYLKNEEFVIHRGCYSIGDWGIISAMPRILKQYYPNCKVYVTSEKFAENIYGPSNKNAQNVWGMWLNPYENVKYIFDNNPYVDSFIDNFDGEIYHDHFRIRELKNDVDPLILQMLRFYEINLNLEDDYCPEIYFSNEEIEEFEEFKRKTFGEVEYGSFSYRYVNERENKPTRLEWIQAKLDHYADLPFIYYEKHEHDFKFKRVLNSDGISVRLLMYLICNSKVCTGLQTGIYDTCSRYTDVDILSAASNVKEMQEHYLSSVKYNFIN